MIYVSQIFGLTLVERGKLFDVLYTFIHKMDYKKRWKETLDNINFDDTYKKLYEYINNKQEFIEKIKYIDPNFIKINIMKLKVKNYISKCEQRIQEIKKMVIDN
jgi:hypothetical protein